jgi:hypothetical protein
MSAAYTENNFNACLDHIVLIKGQRDEAIRIATLMEIMAEEELPDYHPEFGALSKQLSNLKLKVIAYQNSVRQEKRSLK